MHNLNLLQEGVCPQFERFYSTHYIQNATIISNVIFLPQRKTVVVAGQEVNNNKKSTSPVDIRASLRVLRRVTRENNCFRSCKQALLLLITVNKSLSILKKFSWKSAWARIRGFRRMDKLEIFGAKSLRSLVLATSFFIRSLSCTAWVGSSFGIPVHASARERTHTYVCGVSLRPHTLVKVPHFTCFTRTQVQILTPEESV